MRTSILLFVLLILLSNGNQAQTVTDYDGNKYDTVNIGTQVWLKQNLRVTHYNNGLPIPNIPDSATWVGMTTGGRCYYNNDSAAYDSIYGVLYNWYAVNDTSKICPSGWHVSTNTEWLTAENFLGGQTIAGGKMKEAGFAHWTSPNYGATNSSEFTGLPGGMRDPNSMYATVNENGLWWTATAFNATMARSTYLYYLNAAVDHNPAPKFLGMSVRCVMDGGIGIVDINNIDNVKIYPNPVVKQVSIENNTCENFEIQLFNIAGECVLKSESAKRTKVIDLSSLSKGIYIIRISTSDWTVQKKLIKI